MKLLLQFIWILLNIIFDLTLFLMCLAHGGIIYYIFSVILALLSIIDYKIMNKLLDL